MKIPETSNVGGYYGNEENGQWQPVGAGVIIDSGVGGGDAGAPRPAMYPVHVPRGHIPGYVMAGAYYAGGGYPGTARQPDDFADYMWMENEEEFDKQVMQQLEEEALMEQCIEAMLEDEQREARAQRPQNGHTFATSSNGCTSGSLAEAVSRSTLNPLAAEFVPTLRLPEESTESAPEEQKQAQTEAETQRIEDAPEEKASPPDDTKAEEPEQESETPEVSAADLHPADKKGGKKQKPLEAKRPAKTQESKPKVKPLAVKSDTKVQPKKKDVKPVKSETRAEEREDVSIVAAPVEVKPTPPPSEDSQPAGPKPINYAAAAKANKPKKLTTTPTVEKVEKIEPKPVEKKEKPKVKSDVKTTQRKNSAK